MAHILVVEHDDDLRNLLADLLALEGYTVATAEDGQAALELLRHARPDLILLDLLLPRMDGWTFARQCDADPIGHGLPIIVLSTASSASTVLRELAGTGVRRVLEKPFDLGALLALVAALLTPARPLGRGRDPDA
jgi:two-component system response regulator MprA